MKAKLIFKLPEESEDFLRATKATDLAIAIFEITANLRKDTERELNHESSYIDALDLVFEKINNILQDNNINIDEILT